MSYPLIKLQKSKKCYECDEKKKKGSKIYCKKCNESHFVCKDCIPDYLEYERIENPITTVPLKRESSQISEYSINQYSESTVKESQ